MTETCAPLVPGRHVQLCARKGTKLGPAIRDQNDACKFLRGTAAADRESFWGLHLDARNRVVGVEEVAKGSLSGVEVHPREVFKSAIMSNAAAILIAHNHPSGDQYPSRQDVELTGRLAEAGKLLGIPVRDHVIVATDGCHSMRQSNPQMEWGTPEAPPKARKR